jgi:uncharacterized membrane protein YfcA
MDLLLIVTFIVALLSSIMSGLSGGGGGFIMTPFFLLIGLTPQQIVANGAIAGMGLGSSSLFAMRGKRLLERQFLWPLTLLAVVFTILAMFVLSKIHGNTFQVAIGILLVILAPTLFIKKTGLQPGERSKRSILAGYSTYALILFTSSLGSGLATLLFLPMMFLMGMGALQANALRRVLMTLQAFISLCIILPQGFVVWGYAISTLLGCYIGGFIGTKIALRQGERFIKYGLAAVMVVSGLMLLLSTI